MAQNHEKMLRQLVHLWLRYDPLDPVASENLDSYFKEIVMPCLSQSRVKNLECLLERFVDCHHNGEPEEMDGLCDEVMEVVINPKLKKGDDND